MDWSTDDVATLLDQIERVAKERLKGKKRHAMADDIFFGVQNVRWAMVCGDKEDVFLGALLLGLDAGQAGYKEFGLREFLNRSGRPTGQNASRDQTMFEEYVARGATSKMSPTALMTKIGKQHGVGRARSIEVITALAKKTKKPSAK